MPHASYSYVCGCSRASAGGLPTCQTCGQPGRFIGHRKSVVEHWCAFSRGTGLNPVGPDAHVPPEISAAIRERMVNCQLCGGSGYLSPDPESWTHCPRCEGDGFALEGHFRGEA